MFKSIEYKLFLYLTLLVVAVAAGTYAFAQREYVGGGLAVVASLFFISKLYKHYNRFNKNIIFLLNALEQNDFLFNFTEGVGSRRERELNAMMNRIKNILQTMRSEMQENEHFLSIVIENVSTGVIIINEAGHIQNTNKAAKMILGMPVFTHLKQLGNLNEDFPQLFRTIKNGEKKQISISNEREQTQVSLQASLINLKGKTLKIISLNNIGTELEAKEMESWMKLIRVMTHEIMNSVAPITSLTDMLLCLYKQEEGEQSNKELKHSTIDSLSTINTTAKDLTNFVQSYREFSGVSAPQRAPIALIPMMEYILKLEEAEMKLKGIETVLNTTCNDLVIDADRTQLSQVIINLLKNAMDALSNSQDKKIQINITSKADEPTKIEIANNGTPISADVLESIFIPFFTTKETGSGIGLSVSKHIMRLHGGNLKHSYADGWTRFSLMI